MSGNEQFTPLPRTEDDLAELRELVIRGNRPAYDIELESAVRDLEDSLRHNDEPGLPYDPLLRAVRSKSHGYAQRIPSIITGRDHHGLSRHEWAAFILFDWRGDKYINLREQFRLPLKLTQLLASRVPMTHPWNRFEKVDAQMSVDLVATLVGGNRWVAVDIKEDEALNAPEPRPGKRRRSTKRTKQKLRLATVAMALAGVEHTVLTPSMMPHNVVQNIRHLRRFVLPFDAVPLEGVEVAEIEPAMLAFLRAGEPIDVAAEKVGGVFGIPQANLGAWAMWCVATRRWLVDFNEEIAPDLPLTFKA